VGQGQGYAFGAARFTGRVPVMTLASKVTLLRIACIPIFIFIYFNVKPVWISAVVFLFIALTDALDGYLARRYKEITSMGKFLDPLADKLLVAAGLLCLLETRLITSVPVFIIIAREFFISGMRSLSLVKSNDPIAASGIAKIKTVAQITLVIVLLLNLSIFNIPYQAFVIWLTVALTIASGVDYFFKYRDLFFKA
jgi:CDP-diacylglycerol--glycerol-3-phosphate 3-phosphatidyltransferase